MRKTRFSGMLVTATFGAILALVTSPPASAQRRTPLGGPPGRAATEPLPQLKDVAIDQKLDEAVPLDLPFVDASGADVTLRQYFSGARPVVLALVYYECPMLCTQVLNGLVSSITTLTLDAGTDFDVLVVSFDPGETPALAAAKKTAYVERYGRPGTEAGFHFLTGRQSSIDALADAVGFRYVYDEAIDQFAHPAAVTVLTPGGRVSKYLYGIAPAPRDLRLAMVEAAGGRIGTAVDQALLYCFQYDAEAGRYSFVIMRAVRIGGVLTLVVIGAFLFFTLRRERRQEAGTR